MKRLAKTAISSPTMHYLASHLETLRPLLGEKQSPINPGGGIYSKSGTLQRDFNTTILPLKSASSTSLFPLGHSRTSWFDRRGSRYVIHRPAARCFLAASPSSFASSVSNEDQKSFSSLGLIDFNESNLNNFNSLPLTLSGQTIPVDTMGISMISVMLINASALML